MTFCKDRDMDCEFLCTSETRLAKCGISGDYDVCGNIKGIDYLRKKKLNKGLAFTLEERQILGLHGLLPAVIKTPQEQIVHCTMLLDRLSTNLDKYIYLIGLSERNQRLFFQLIASNIEKFVPLIASSTVGEACIKYSLIYQQPMGLYITIKDKGHVYDVLSNWPERDVRVIVVTDGERILGLGDLGANGMGVPISKLMLYTALGGIKPHFCLPITLDCGTNRNNLILDPLYIGMRERRVRGRIYDEFIDEFMQAVVRRFGQHCVIQFEDFGRINAFRLLEKYREDFCTFNDDIQGTGAAILAAIFTALKAIGNKLTEQVFVFQGAGEACIGMARMCLYAMVHLGADRDEAKKQIFMVDTKGLVVNNRPSGGLTIDKLEFAQNWAPIDTLFEVVAIVRPSILIGASGTPCAFTKEILELMGQINNRPIIFAMSNPIILAECTAQQAYNFTKGRCFFASGSPFPPVEYEKKKYYTSQCNNCAIYPGLALGVLCAGMYKIPREVFFIAAETLSDLVTRQEVETGRLYPRPSKLVCSSMEIAKWIMEYAYRFDLATIFPEPTDKIEFIKSQIYDPNYPSIIPELYSIEP